MSCRRSIILFLLTVAISVTAIAADPGVITADRVTVSETAVKVAPSSDDREGYLVFRTPGRGRVNEPSELKAPSALYRFRIDHPGVHTVTLTMRAADNGSDSCHWSLDQGKTAVAGPNRYGKWQQVRLGSFELTSGEHVLRLWVRENGLQLSRIAIVSGATTQVSTADLERYPPPPIRPPAGHPRVMIRPELLPQLKVGLEAKENLASWQQVRKLAERQVSGIIGPGNKNIYGNYDLATLTATEAKAFMFLVGRGDHYGREAVNIMLDFMRTAVFTDHREASRPLGQTIYTAALVYDWCYPLLTAKEKTMFITRVKHLAGQLEVGYPPVKQGNVTSHGGEAQIFRDQLSAGIAFYDEDPEMYRLSAGRIFAAMIAPRNFFYVSGRHHQGISYGHMRFQWELFSAWLFEQMCGKKIYSDAMAQVPYSWLYARLPDGEIFPDGDTYWTGNYWKFTYSTFLSCSYFKDPVLKEEFYRQDGAKWAVANPVLFLLLNDPSLPPKGLNNLPLTRFFPEPLGGMICRTGWSFGRKAPAVVAEMKGAGYQFNNHQHLDAGGFLLYYRGTLAADLGSYTGMKYGTDYDFSFNKRSIAHNVMLAYDPAEQFGPGGEKFRNDGGQRFPNNAREPDDLAILLGRDFKNGAAVAHGFGPDTTRPLFSHLKVDLKAAYSGKIRDYVRSFCFLNLGRTDIPAVMVVFDRMTTARPEFKKYWLLNSCGKPEFAADTVTVVRNTDGYDGKMVCTALLPERNDRTFRRVGGPDHPNDVFGHSYTTSVNSPYTTGWRTEISPVKPAATDLFLNVLQVSAAEEKTVLPTELIRHGKIVGASVADRVVTFAADGGILADSIEVPVKSRTKSQVLITDLKPGWWSVAPKGGRPFGRGLVCDAGKSLFLILEPGIYELTPGADDRIPSLPSYVAMQPEKPSRTVRLEVAGKNLPLNRPLPQVEQVKLVPVAALKAGGATVKDDGKTLTAIKDGHRLVCRAGERQAVYDGLTFELDTAAARIDGEWYLPASNTARFLRLNYYPDAIDDDVVFTVPHPATTSVWLTAVTAGASSDSSPYNAVDGNHGTYWAAPTGEDSWLRLLLSEPAKIDGIAISWYYGARRQYRFEVLTSINGRDWVQVLTGNSSGKSDRPEKYFFPRPVEARMVMIKGRGNSENQWNSLQEVIILIKEKKSDEKS